MLIRNVPSLGVVSGGMELRREAARIQAYAEIAFGKGARDYKEALVKFWQFQKEAINRPGGLPGDGPYLGAGRPDLRMLCYKVLSHMRRHAGYKEMWEGFCDALIADAWGLDDNESKVASLVVTPIYKEGKTEYSWSDSDLVCSVDILDATGHSLVASAEKPLLGQVDWMLVDEGSVQFQGKWRNDFKSVTASPYTMSVGSISTRKAGESVVKLRYVYKDREVVGEATYKRAENTSGA